MSWSTMTPGAAAWPAPWCRPRSQHAEEAGARTVDLTSRPDREAANRLYVRLGFEKRETNVYRYDVSLLS